MIEKESKAIYNAAVFYVLPMLQLNKSSFGTKNLVNCYVDKSGYIVVDLKSSDGVDDKYLYSHEHYITDYDIEDGVRVIYSIPEEGKKDIELFIAGKYSQLSADLKIAVSKIPGVHENVLKVFNPSKQDRQRIADDLHVSVDYIKEIRSVPRECNFISIK